MEIDASIPEPEDVKLDNSLERENVRLKATLAILEAELSKFRNPPLVVCEVKKIMKDKAIVKLDNNHSFLVDVSSHLQDKIQPREKVLAHQKSLTVVDTLEKAKSFSVEPFIVLDKPDVKWGDVGGLDAEIFQIKEVLELPVIKPELFKKMGIKPHKGVLLYGPSGCGKTLIAKAVAASSNFTFIEVVASELVQKYIGEGSKLVKDIFQLAREKAPAIIFIDEIDALASERVDVGASGEREVQRTFMQFLSELDGFKNLDNVKVIGATNRIDILDSAILRPGRLDRLIEVGHPDAEGREKIFRIYTKGMPLKKSVNFKKLVKLSEGCSGAEIKSVCTEAGYGAIREDCDYIDNHHLLKALEKVKSREEMSDKSYMRMFG